MQFCLQMSILFAQPCLLPQLPFPADHRIAGNQSVLVLIELKIKVKYIPLAKITHFLTFMPLSFLEGVGERW